MKVIVFGGAGFLGSFVADALTEQGHEVIIFDKRPSPYLKDGQTGVIGDVLNKQDVLNVLDGCDVVYNFAGVADIATASENPADTLYVNVMGNTVLLESARQRNVKRFVFASTLYVYSESGSFYRVSKQSCELVIEEYWRAFSLPYTILRYGSLYGPRADDSNWIHRTLKQALIEGKIVRYGDGEEIREYIHVSDAARSSVEVLADEYKNSHIIISGQQSLRIRDMLTMISEMLGHRVSVEYRVPENENCSGGGSLHYQITPYSFRPNIARKLVRSSYLDLGQGMLSLINEIYRENADKIHSMSANS